MPRVCLVRGLLRSISLTAGWCWAGTGCDKRAARARRECVGAHHSMLAPQDRATGHLGWLQMVLPPVGMVESGMIEVGSGVGEIISEREKEREREIGEKGERKDEDIFFQVFEF